MKVRNVYRIIICAIQLVMMMEIVHSKLSNLIPLLKIAMVSVKVVLEFI
jgi:hypothetical protein